MSCINNVGLVYVFHLVLFVLIHGIVALVESVVVLILLQFGAKADRMNVKIHVC